MKQVPAVDKLASIFFLFVFFLFSPREASAAPWDSSCKAVTGVTRGPDDVAILQGFECLFASVISAALALAGIVLFIMFVIGGFKYLTAGGDPKAVEAAKKTLTHAIAGLVVLVLAYLILKLIQAITGVDVSQFKIYQF